MNGASVHLDGLTKRYGPLLALDEIDLEIQAGEFLTLLGPSGSGKSTILNIIAGFIQPDTGQVRIGGRSIIGIPPHRRGLGVVFQSYALFPHMSVVDNVSFPLRMRHHSKSVAERKVREILSLVGLHGLENRYPDQLSGGQQQRVAVARAIVFEPSILLMDEPLGALDKKLREQLQGELRGLHERLGLTFIYVTHDQEEALSMSDRVAVLNNGRLVQVGTTREVYERPASEFVATFLGESNFLEGVVVGSDGDSVVAVGDVRMRATLEKNLPPGTPVRLYIRPNQIRVAESGGDGHEASVIEARFLGESIRARLSLRNGVQLLARLPSHEASLSAGDTIRITWETQHLRNVEGSKTQPPTVKRSER